MIEMRVVDNGVMCRLDFQYRYKNQLPQGCIAPPDWKEWSDWVNSGEYFMSEEGKEFLKEMNEFAKQHIKKK
jgi:hypothetical protein